MEGRRDERGDRDVVPFVGARLAARGGGRAGEGAAMEGVRGPEILRAINENLPALVVEESAGAGAALGRWIVKEWKSSDFRS